MKGIVVNQAYHWINVLSSFYLKLDQTRFYLLMFIGTPLFIVKWGLVYCELEVPRRSNIPFYFLLKLRSSRACFKYFRTWNSINTWNNLSFLSITNNFRVSMLHFKFNNIKIRADFLGLKNIVHDRFSRSAEVPTST